MVGSAGPTNWTQEPELRGNIVQDSNSTSRCPGAGPHPKSITMATAPLRREATDFHGPGFTGNAGPTPSRSLAGVCPGVGGKTAYLENMRQGSSTLGFLEETWFTSRSARYGRVGQVGGGGISTVMSGPPVAVPAADQDVEGSGCRRGHVQEPPRKHSKVGAPVSESQYGSAFALFRGRRGRAAMRDVGPGRPAAGTPRGPHHGGSDAPMRPWPISDRARRAAQQVNEWHSGLVGTDGRSSTRSCRRAFVCPFTCLGGSIRWA